MITIFYGYVLYRKSLENEINKNNYAAYTILQLFNDFSKQDQLDESSRQKMLDYIKSRNVTQKELFELSLNFSSQTTKKMIRSGIINEIA